MDDLNERVVKATKIIKRYLDYRDRLDMCMIKINERCGDIVNSGTPAALEQSKMEMLEALKRMKKTCEEIRGQIKYEGNEEIDNLSSRIDNNIDEISHMCSRIGRNINNISNFRALQNNQLDEMQVLTTKVAHDIHNVGIEITQGFRKEMGQHKKGKDEQPQDKKSDERNQDDDAKDETKEETKQKAKAQTEKSNLILDAEHIPGYIHEGVEYITKDGKFDTENRITKRFFGSVKILCQKATEDITERYDLKNNSNAIALIELYDELSKFCDSLTDVETLYKLDEEIDRKTKVLDSIEQSRVDEEEETQAPESQEAVEPEVKVQEAEEQPVGVQAAEEQPVGVQAAEEPEVIEMESSRIKVSGAKITQQAVKNLNTRLIIRVDRAISSMEKNAERESTAKGNGDTPSDR